MKFRHTAVLALVGWYLMLPPMDGNIPNVKAAFSQWDILLSFDIAETCESKRADLRSKILGRVKNDEAANRLDTDRRLIDARCIATDDPRLKGN
jgi:hypothetical protein